MGDDFDAARVDRGEIFRALGYGETQPDEEMKEAVEEAVDALMGVLRPRYVAKVYVPRDAKNGIRLTNSSLMLQGESIRRHLDGAERVVLMAATLGTETERAIRTSQGKSPTKGLIIDAVANEAIEKYCDWVQERIYKENLGFCMGSRFSPGYGDLPIELQGDIVAELDAYRCIGLSCSQDFLLIPRKSVTAFIGLFNEEPREMMDKCEDCRLAEGCQRRKKGLHCGRH